MAYKVTEEGRTVKLGAKAREAGGAAMRGTDNAMLAVAPYYYTGALANNATFVPAAGVTVQVAIINQIIAALADWRMWDPGVPLYILDSFAQAVTAGFNTIQGPIYCDGALGFRNTFGAAKDIYLYGFV